jgi:hypothetical protein
MISATPQAGTNSAAKTASRAMCADEGQARSAVSQSSCALLIGSPQERPESEDHGLSRSSAATIAARILSRHSRHTTLDGAQTGRSQPFRHIFTPRSPARRRSSGSPRLDCGVHAPAIADETPPDRP